MAITWQVFWVIVGGTIVTIIPRVFPLVVLSKLNIPQLGLRWLAHIPVAIMAALLAQELLLPTKEFSYFWDNIRLLAALPALLVAIITRSLLGTVVVGIFSMMALRWFL